MCQIPLLKLTELDTWLWKRVIKEAAVLGVQTVVFSGGEPLLREDIFELISYVDENGMRSCLTSNGTLINAQTAKQLSESKIAVINISIEGPAYVHDYLRGAGTYAKAVEGLYCLRQQNIESTIATMVSANNYRSLPDIVELAHRLGVTTIKFQPFNSLFLSDKSAAGSFFVSAKEEGKLEGVMNQVMHLCSHYGISTNPASYLKEISEYLCGGRTPRKKGCLALYLSCPVNAQGEIYPCWVLANKDNLLGNLNDNGLVEILNSSRRKQIIQKIMHSGCQGCIMSCYDDNFGTHAFNERLRVRFNKSFKLLKQRIVFYSSYQGSFKSLLRKVVGFLDKSKSKVLPASNADVYEKVREEISLVKNKLKKELRAR